MNQTIDEQELEKIKALGAVELEKAGKYPKHWVVLYGVYDLKRCRRMELWEIEQLRRGIIKYLFAKLGEQLIITLEDGRKYRLKASKIPNEWTALPQITVIGCHDGKVVRSNGKISKVDCKAAKTQKKISEVDTNVYDTLTFSKEDISAVG